MKHPQSSRISRISPREGNLKGLLRKRHIRVIGFSSLQIQPGWSTHWAKDSHPPDFWRIYRNDQPMDLHYSQGIVQQPAGTLAVIPPLAGFHPKVQHPTSHSFLHFELPHLPLELCTQLFPAPVVLRGRAIQSATQLLQSLAMKDPLEPVTNPAEPFLVEAAAHLTFAQVVNGLDAEGQQALLEGMRGENPVSAAIARIQSNLASPPTLDELARDQGLSRRSFTARFREWTRRSPHQYILNERLQTAADLLAGTSDSLETIAARTGFCDRFHLTKAFRHRHGQSPAAFRSRMAQREAPGAIASTPGSRGPHSSDANHPPTRQQASSFRLPT